MSLLDVILLADISVFTLFWSYLFLNIDLTNGVVRTQTSGVTRSLLLSSYVFVRIIYKILLYPIYVDPLRHLPQAPQEPLLNRFFTEPDGPQHEAWLNTIPNNGLIRYHGRLNATRILVTTPAGCEQVLQTQAALFPKQPSVRKILKMWLGPDTLLSSTNGDGHKSLRKKLLPAFYARNIRALQPVFRRKALQMCDALHKIVAYNNDRVLEVNLDDVIDRAALDVVGSAGHGVDFDTLREPKGRLGQLHKRAFDLGKNELQVVLSALFLPDWIFGRLPFKVYRENRAGVKALRAHCRQVIRDDPAAATDAEEKNVVGMASQMGNFSEDDLVDLSMDLLVAGHKTVASALQLTFYTLARHPDVQARLRAEITPAYPVRDRASGPDASKEPTTPYLDAVLNEILRLYPPVAGMQRRTHTRTTIGGEVIPAGSNVVVSQWAMNRSHAQWGADAAAFVPERWLQADDASRRPPLLTFSRGPRNCIGEGFARKELAALVSAMVGRFELSIVDGVTNPDEEGEAVGEIQQGITLRIKGGCRVGVKEVDTGGKRVGVAERRRGKG